MHCVVPFVEIDHLGFNEAASSCSRKSLRSGLACGEVHGFNEAASSCSRKCTNGLLMTGSVSASMRPRAAARGNGPGTTGGVHSGRGFNEAASSCSRKQKGRTPELL